jgi:kumamolisin
MPRVLAKPTGVFHHYHRLSLGKLATVPSNGYTGANMAKAYGFPSVPTTAPMPTVWIPELGGGFDSTEIANWCKSHSFPMPNLMAVGVGGATNSYTGDPQSADVEVELDIVNVIGTLAYMFGSTRPANITVVFAPNTESGMPEAYQYVLANAKPGDTCSLSWGGPESSYSSSDIQTMESLLQQLAVKGITCTFASGDNGPDDGTSIPVTDYPGCSAWGVDCGATTITLNSDGSIANQVPWNSGGGASGGGYSKIIARPNWQSSVGVANGYRGEPDCCANGDPATGWDTPFGVVGGTSAVAPFMAAYFAGVNALLLAAGKPPLGLPNALMYANEATCFTDVVTGSIGNGFPATTGWDTASGLGSIKGQAFASVALGGTAPAPPPTPPVPTSPPAPPPTPLPTGLSLAQVGAVMVKECQRLEANNPGIGIVHRPSFIAAVGQDLFNAISAVWPH